MEFNPHRAPPSGERREARVEKPGEFPNLVWQTRSAPPTDYENRLGDALVACFEEGIEELGPLVARLNEMDVFAPDGTPWTEDAFEREMEILGG